MWFLSALWKSKRLSINEWLRTNLHLSLVSADDQIVGRCTPITNDCGPRRPRRWQRMPGHPTQIHRIIIMPQRYRGDLINWQIDWLQSGHSVRTCVLSLCRLGENEAAHVGVGVWEGRERGSVLSNRWSSHIHKHVLIESHFLWISCWGLMIFFFFFPSPAQCVPCSLPLISFSECVIAFPYLENKRVHLTWLLAGYRIIWGR